MVELEMTEFHGFLNPEIVHSKNQQLIASIFLHVGLFTKYLSRLKNS